MLTRIRDHQGFTLIELLVVIAIIAILAAIAIPNFLGMRIRAYNSGANTEAGNARIAQETYQTDWETYTSSIGELQKIDGNLARTSGVTFSTVAGGPSAYTVVTYHQSGDKTYTATVTGIERTEGIPAAGP